MAVRAGRKRTRKILQRHAIRGLVMESSCEHTGLLGISTGTAIRNVVLDRSCSVTGSYTNATLDASTGNVSSGAGALKRTNNAGAVIRNCANYTMVFILGNGATAEAAFLFNETIEYPSGVKREGGARSLGGTRDLPRCPQGTSHSLPCGTVRPQAHRHFHFHRDRSPRSRPAQAPSWAGWSAR